MSTVIDEYIGAFPPEAAQKLSEICAVIREAAPGAAEKMSWAMPTFYYRGNLVHFAGHKTHIGFYPGSEAVEHFADKLLEYHTSKGAIQFPYSKPLPAELVREITRFRAEANGLLK